MKLQRLRLRTPTVDEDSEINLVMRSRYALFPFLGAFVFVAFAGCGGNVHVTGKVTFPNGQPLTAGQVIFTDDFYMGRSDIDRNGEYSIHTLRRNDGVRKGTYRVYITGAMRLEGGETTLKGIDSIMNLSQSDFKTADVVQLIDMQHTNPDTTGWIFEVKKNSKIDLVVYPPGEVPENERTEAARLMFEPGYREKQRSQNASDGNRAEFQKNRKRRTVDPRLL